MNATLSTTYKHLYTLLIAGLLTLTACATPIPATIKNAPADNPIVTEVQQAPRAYLNKTARWGGTVISTVNLQDKTEMIILARPLDSRGEPETGDQSDGRFIAIINGFIDPAIYAAGRAVTVYGKLGEVVQRKIDNFEYHYPVMKVQQFYLWDIPEKYDYYDYPYWYDPWYPWYPYPYYRPYWPRR